MFLSLASLCGSWHFKWEVCLLQRFFLQSTPLEGNSCQGPATTHPQCSVAATPQISDPSVVHDLQWTLEALEEFIV